MLEVQVEAAHSEAVAMPIKTGTWRRDFVGLEARRLEAARMFAHGASQAEVARTFGVSAQAASVWYRRWRQGGEAALRAAGRAGRRPRLSAAELEAVEEALGKGPEAFGRGVPEVSFHAAGSYSWISPPRRSRRRNPSRIGPLLGSPGTDGTGAR